MALVGAGPGDPSLLTVRAVECLAQADLILHDKLVSARILDLASVHAERICVDQLPGEHPHRWPFVHGKMIEAARQNKRVVRLKGGDPFIFGRGGEETAALRAAGIPYEIVPGVTAALGAAACAEIPLTHRATASAVALVTGHENPTKVNASLDWAALARFPGTLAIYMGMARLDLIVKVLIDHGKAPNTPAAIVQAATTGWQQTAVTTLERLEVTARDEGLAAPAIVVIGPVVKLRPQTSWFEQRPLFGKRVLITRPRHQADEMTRQLSLLGAIPFVLPAVEISEPLDWAPVDDAIERIKSFDWLVFTSANGVRYFFRRLLERQRDLRAIGAIQIAAIGPKTAQALAAYHLVADLTPSEFRSEQLAMALKPIVIGKRVLLARADRGRELLRTELASVADVEQVAVYSQRDAIDLHSDTLLALSRGEIGYVTLTSANIARAFLNSLNETGRNRIHEGVVKLVSISPVTTEAIRELGFDAAAEAREFTVDGVVAALVDLARQANADASVFP